MRLEFLQPRLKIWHARSDKKTGALEANCLVRTHRIATATFSMIVPSAHIRTSRLNVLLYSQPHNWCRSKMLFPLNCGNTAEKLNWSYWILSHRFFPNFDRLTPREFLPPLFPCCPPRSLRGCKYKNATQLYCIVSN